MGLQHDRQTSPPPFDRELGLDDLLKGIDRERLLAALAVLAGGPVRLARAGSAGCGGRRVALRAELETVGHLETDAEAGERLGAAAQLVELLLDSGRRYVMASDLHRETVQSDYEELQRKHAALTVSEARYKELAAQLEQRVAEQVKTIETAQRQLYQAEKLAAVGQLAAGVAHEINNPVGFIKSNLNTARSYVETLTGYAAQLNGGAERDALVRAWREQDLDFVLGDFQELLHESIDGAERVARIVSDLKGFSNVDRPDEEMADINEIVRGVCNVAGGEIARYADLALDLGTLPRTRCRPGHLGQAFLNLLLNAAQAMQGRGEIRVQSIMHMHDICVRIMDNGPGIPEDVRERIFDPFFTTRDIGQGTGLGLTVSRDIVQAHGGRLLLDSEVGRGTTAAIYLPVAD